ncbi:PucR family transcriptional regulator ligand-binding domain-containing protein [Promicromonospora soli]
MVFVRALLEADSLALTAVHLPHPDGDVRWVATSELYDPTPFLEGGEVLLTTGLEMKGWQAEWHGYVARLVARHVVALGFATGLTHQAVPAKLASACQDQGLNLFEVPRSTTFVAISRVAASMLEIDGENAARSSLEEQRQLLRAALRQDDATAVVTRLAEIVNGAAALVGRYAIEPRGPARAELDLDLAAAEIERILPQGLRAAATVQAGAGTLMVQPVGVTGPPVAHLAVYVPRRTTGSERTAIATAVTLLSLAAQTRLARRDSDRRVRSRALELFVEADVRAAVLVLATTDGSPVLPDRVVIIRATGTDNALDDALDGVEDDVPMVGCIRGELWVVDVPERVDRHVKALAGKGLLVGVGDPATPGNARVSWVNAGHALTSATPAAPVVTWDRLIGEGALALLDGDRAAAFATSFLSRLDDQLVGTLRSFLRHHGSRLKVSEEAPSSSQHSDQPDRADRSGCWRLPG